MQVQFLGAAQTVTGSCYVISANSKRFAVDCGMHQGNSEVEKRNRDISPYGVDSLDFVLVTHAHIDHSGLLPKLAREGYKGPIYCTAPTKDLLDIMLLDSAHIQEMEAEWASRRHQRRGAESAEEPLYTQKDAVAASSLLRSVDYNTPFEPAPGIRVTYRDAGHILGAAFLEIIVTEAERPTTLLFSGDLGRSNSLIVNDPSTPTVKADYLFMESTYGDRDHKDPESSMDELVSAINYALKNRGKIIIPAFAVERTQEVIYTLHLLHRAGKLPDIPVFVDSPLAIRATEIFRRHPECYDEDMRKLMAEGEDPLSLPNLRYTLDTRDSQAINELPGSAIVIAASGMCNAGRIKHHLRHNIWKPGASIVFVGYQGVGTPGRKIVDGAKTLRLFNEELAIKAKIWTIGGFSGHAGQKQILDWVGGFAHPHMKIMLVHGEEKAQATLAGLLRQRFSLEVNIPGYLEEVILAPGHAPLVQTDLKKAAPKVNWEMLLQDTEAKVAALRGRLGDLQKQPWSDQIELRDQTLEINSQLLALLSRI